MQSIQIAKTHWEQMRGHVEKTAPIEACGFVSGDKNISSQTYPITNSLQSTTRYRLDEVEMVRAMHNILEHGWNLLAIYHSHPQRPAEPSPTDLAEAAFLDSAQLIWGQKGGYWDARAYLYDSDEKVKEITISIV